MGRRALPCYAIRDSSRADHAGRYHMVVDEQAPPLPETAQSARLWCYLVSLCGQLYAVPDEPGAVLMPHIGRLPAITPLPLGLVPPYVHGLVNVSQHGEL